MGHLRHALLFSSALLVGVTTACDTVRTVKSYDAGLICGANERIIDGECKFVCDRDSDCPAGEGCNLFTGQCQPLPPQTDAGVTLYPCTDGAIRCRADNTAVEMCTEAGSWITKDQCAADGFCLNEQCLACEPGVSKCDPGDIASILSCPNDGSGWQTLPCKGTATCLQGECRECAPNTTRCSPDGKNVQTCQKTSDQQLSWQWTNSGDNFDSTCITGVCLNTSPATCQAPECIPGTTRCNTNPALQDVCSATGSWSPLTCSSVLSSPNAVCQNGVCVDECADAVQQKSYFGCEYWTAVQDNSVSPIFKGNTASGQGTADSEFAFAIANRSFTPATVKIYRMVNNAEQLLKTVTVDAKSAPTKGLNVVKVPWQSIGTVNDQTSVTGKQRWAYRITSTRPVTVYQFSPLTAELKNQTVTTTQTCLFSFECLEYANGTCTSGACRYTGVNEFSYSNDASLLLPAHILGTQYVAVSHEHMVWANNTSSPPTTDFASHLTIVGTQNGTNVTVKSNAKTIAGGGILAFAKGQTQTFTLNSYDVLQIATANLGTAYAECSSNPYPTQAGKQQCRVDNDLTGSVVSSDKPIAVFGGSACSVMSNSAAACDHLEEQVFPFSTWGKTFAVKKSHPVRLTTGGFASAAQMSPDYYKVVASCSTTAASTPCPTGTLITFNVPPSAADILVPSQTRCLSGSIASNTCRLAGGSYIEFRSKADFTVAGDFPIAVAQTFAGQSATAGNAAQGDPSLILLPPVEQWRAEYTVQAAPGLKDNFIAISIDKTKVASVTVDGINVTGWSNIGTTAYQTVNWPVSVGVHTINVAPLPGQTKVPGAGVVVYGFDAYVSYGYTGGLDLGSIVSGIDPGG